MIYERVARWRLEFNKIEWANGPGYVYYGWVACN